MVGFNYTCKALNYLIGPVEPGILMEFYGYAQTGKTTLSAYLPIVEIASQNELPENGVFVILDGDEGFSKVRLKQIVKAYGLDWEDIERRLWLLAPLEFREQHDMAKQLRKRLKAEEKVPVLIVADAITMVYRGIILRTSMQHRAKTIGNYQGKLDLQLNEMRRLAIRNECPLFVTTWRISPIGKALGGPEPEADMIGGRIFMFLPKVIVRLEQPRTGKPERLAILKKHRDKPEGLAKRFRLTNGGVEDVKDE